MAATWSRCARDTRAITERSGFLALDVTNHRKRHLPRLRKFNRLANVRNPDVAGVHNENDLNMLTRDC